MLSAPSPSHPGITLRRDDIHLIQGLLRADDVLRRDTRPDDGGRIRDITNGDTRIQPLCQGQERERTHRIYGRGADNTGQPLLSVRGVARRERQPGSAAVQVRGEGAQQDGGDVHLRLRGEDILPRDADLPPAGPARRALL